MSRRTVLIALVLLAAIAVISFRHYFSPGEVVRRTLISTIEAFEEERLLAVMSRISRGYSDPFGFDYETIGGSLNQAMETYENLDLEYVLAKPEVSGEEVRIEVEFVLWGRYQGTRGSVVGSITEPCTATVLWRKEAPGWRFVSTPGLDIPELRDELASRRRNHQF
jgi:hypothetical protein